MNLLKRSIQRLRDRRAPRRLDVLILGPVPPPFGGVATHISRVVPRLREAGLDVGVLNHFDSAEQSFVVGALKRNPLNYYFMPRRFRASVVHYHHSKWLALIAFVLANRARTSRSVITLHGNALVRSLRSRMPFVGRLSTWALRHFDTIIVVNPHFREAIRRFVVQPILVLPAYVPAKPGEAQYEHEIEQFLSRGQTLVVPAFRVNFLPDGRDLYGLDLAVAAFAAVAPERPELRLLLFIAEPPRGRRSAAYLDSLLSRLRQLDLHGRARVVFGQPLVPALRPNVVLVRPTRLEGDSISVREALEEQIPVIASDVVDRPRRVTTFKTGDIGALQQAIIAVVDTCPVVKEPARRGAHDVAVSQAIQPLLRIYGYARTNGAGS